MACGDVLSLEDLQTAKKHQIFEAEVITGKAGGVAGGATIGTATNPVTGQTQQTLPSILADLGLDVQPWTSSTGGVLASANQVFLNDTSGSLGLGDYYAWGGPFPKTVPAGTDPALPTSGYVMRSSRFATAQAREALRRSYAEAGSNMVSGSFEAGGTLVNANDVLLQERTGKAFSGPAGSVPAGTNPAGGGFVDISQNKYMAASIPELRSTEPVTDGQRINVLGYFTDTPLVGGGTFIHYAASTAAEDFGNVIVTAGGKRWLRWKPVTLGFVDAQNFGCIAPRDISVLLQNAINTKFNVQLPAGDFTSSVTFNRHKGQIISGAGVPERSLTSANGITVLTFTADVNGFDNTPNVALGGGVRNMLLVGPASSTKIGVKDGVKGQEGGPSQAIGCLHENLIIKNFATPFQLSGWAWETTLRRVIADSFSAYGFDITDAANVVHLDNCSAILSASRPSGARTGIRVDRALCVHLTTFRAENNRNAMEISGGAKVTFDGLYLEGNRDNDIIIRDPETSLVGLDALFQHKNEGTTTNSLVNAKSTCNNTTTVDIRSAKVIVSKGESGNNNNLSYMYLGEAPANVRINNINWKGAGALWAAFAGRYAPVELSFTTLPGVRLIGNRNSPTHIALMEGYLGVAAPASSLFSLANYDGSVINTLSTGSRVVSNTFSNGVDYWVWDGAAFVASNR